MDMSEKEEFKEREKVTRAKKLKLEKRKCELKEGSFGRRLGMKNLKKLSWGILSVSGQKMLNALNILKLS